MVTESVYEFLANEDRAVERKYHVVDLDPYGRLEDDKSDLRDSVAAAIDVQTRANVRDWLLLLQTEVASARHDRMLQHLATAESVMMSAYGSEISRCRDTKLIGDAPTENWRAMVRVSARLSLMPRIRDTKSDYLSVHCIIAAPMNTGFPLAVR